MSFLKRQQPPVPVKTALLAGFGGAAAIGVLGMASTIGTPLLMAPFGASCVLLFSAPKSPLSQPANVVFGHAVSALVGLLCLAMFPAHWGAVAVAVGIAISAMALLRVTHPPAGANPLVIFATSPSPDFFVFPVVSGAVLLVAVAWSYHRILKSDYPS